MENLQAQIEERINAMVGEVLVLVRRAAIDSVNNALSGTTAVGRRPAGGTPVGGRRKRSSEPQNRRSLEDLASLRERLYAEVAKAPGEGMALYSKQLGLSVRELSLPTQQLRKTGRVRTVGERDRMLYFPMGQA